uniref:class I SAM-dependent methyltransferase n=1 Tax=Parerythrobacter lutipelagi TaxID=1964208 RepID=UPI001375E7BB|nr:class I SAM-dependent methyltransferase [Parerythrobacter lutipelagi]
MSDRGVEQDADFYDAKVRDVAHWTVHYTQSHYYPIRTVVADRLNRSGRSRVLDIGCGSGQVGAMLADLGLADYLGVDLSPGMVRQASKACPSFEFRVADIHHDNVLESHDYDCVIMLEFLEHIEADLAVIERIRPGTLVLGTVPNFGARSHVRHFRDSGEVRDRYGALLAELDVSEIRANERGAKFFVLQGIR